jgi:hypothetical protein
MRAAVLAYIAYKFDSDRGTLKAGPTAAWRDGVEVRREIPAYSSRAIDATVAYCEYLFDRYGRFPATVSPFENMLAYQAHHLDLQFYDTHYRPEALGPNQRSHRHG